MKKILLLLIFMCLTMLEAKDRAITIQLNWLNQFQFAGYYIAKEKGYYKDVGLDVTIKEFDYKTNVVSSVLEKKADFAVGRSSLIIDKINGKNIVALAAIYQHSPLMLLVKDNSDIKSVQDLKNKKIMMTKDATFSASILAMLNANKIKEDDINIMNHSFDLEDLISGKTDAMASYLSNEPIRLERRAIKYRVLHPKDYGFDFYSDILFTSSSFIENNPKVTKDFYEASIKGWKYAFENIAKTSELIFNQYNTQNKSLITLIKEGEVLKKLAISSDGDIGCLEKDRIDEITNVFKVLGVISKDINAEEFIYKENSHKEIVFSLTPNQKTLLIFSAVFLCLLFILILYFMKKLRFEKQLLDSVINSSRDLIYYKDSKLNYIGCNISFEKFVGEKKEKIIGKNIFDFFAEPLASKLNKIDKKVLRENTIEITHQWMSSISGEKLYLQTQKIPFEYALNKRGVLSISRDLTKLKKLETESLNQQKIFLTQSKIAAVGEMLGNIAHQWRQPLSVITTHVSGLKLSLELKKELPQERIITCLDDVLLQSRYLSETIDDFKNFFTSDSDIKKVFNIKDALLKMKNLTKDNLKSGYIETIYDLEDCNINNNENNLVQAFLNICNNSKDAMVLSDMNVEERYLFISLKKMNEEAIITFKDSGGGMSKKVIDKIFEPYFTTKHQSIGTGIGLYMTHQIITKHLNGNIEAKTLAYEYNGKKLKGAEFIIKIPLV